MMREAWIALTASSRSASAMTMAGAFPPSSSETFVTLSAAACMIATPPSTLPVKLTMPTAGWLARA
jgi:hypothetical protein